MLHWTFSTTTRNSLRESDDDVMVLISNGTEDVRVYLGEEVSLYIVIVSDLSLTRLPLLFVLDRIRSSVWPRRRRTRRRMDIIIKPLRGRDTQ